MCVNRISIISCYFYLAHKSGNPPRGLSINQSGMDNDEQMMQKIEMGN